MPVFQAMTMMRTRTAGRYFESFAAGRWPRPWLRYQHRRDAGHDDETSRQYINPPRRPNEGKQGGPRNKTISSTMAAFAVEDREWHKRKKPHRRVLSRLLLSSPLAAGQAHFGSWRALLNRASTPVARLSAVTVAVAPARTRLPRHLETRAD